MDAPHAALCLRRMGWYGIGKDAGGNIVLDVKPKGMKIIIR